MQRLVLPETQNQGAGERFVFRIFLYDFTGSDDVLDRRAGNITLEHGLQGVRRPFNGTFLDSLDPFDLAHTLALPCNGNASNAPVMSHLLNIAEDAGESGRVSNFCM